jgi:hypothetical protein
MNFTKAFMAVFGTLMAAGIIGGVALHADVREIKVKVNALEKATPTVEEQVKLRTSIELLTAEMKAVREQQKTIMDNLFRFADRAPGR